MKKFRFVAIVFVVQILAELSASGLMERNGIKQITPGHGYRISNPSVSGYFIRT